MGQLKEQFGLRVLYLRKKAKLSQKELADKIGIAEGSIGRLERGLIGLKFSNIEILADVFEVEVWELFKFN